MNNIAGINKIIAPEFISPLPKEEISIGGIGDKSCILNFEGGNINSDASALLLKEVEE